MRAYFYAPEWDRTLRWDDPVISITWPLLDGQPPVQSPKDAQGKLWEEADKFDAYGDKLTLNTVLMAISLFLLGVAAVVSARRTQYALIGIGGGIFLLALGLSVTIPFTWI